MHPKLVARLPFDTGQNDVVISQGFNGPYSHNRFLVRGIKYDLRYALDFALPCGTTVLAVRDGIVRMLANGDGSYYEGTDPDVGRSTSAASLTISHSDITEYPGMVFSHYQHLDPEGFIVKSGDFVRSGQSLAKTGKTGWIGTVPHLHFNFQYINLRPHEERGFISVPFLIQDYDENLEDEIIMKAMKDDSRELIKKIMAVRKKDGYIKDK